MKITISSMMFLKSIRVTLINTMKEDIYEQNYNTKEGKRISNEGDLAYQKALFELYEEIFAELREVAKNLK
jgi:hypothetical protein